MESQNPCLGYIIIIIINALFFYGDHVTYKGDFQRVCVMDICFTQLVASCHASLTFNSVSFSYPKFRHHTFNNNEHSSKIACMKVNYNTKKIYAQIGMDANTCMQ